MKDIIRAMRVLAEVSESAANDIGRLIDDVEYGDHIVLTSRMTTKETFEYLGELLSKAADRLESELEPEWISWSGSYNPPACDRVDVKLRSGEIFCDEKTESFEWKNFDTDGDIIAYRIVK